MKLKQSECRSVLWETSPPSWCGNRAFQAPENILTLVLRHFVMAPAAHHPALLLDLICSFTSPSGKGRFAWGARGRGIPDGSS